MFFYTPCVVQYTLTAYFAHNSLYLLVFLPLYIPSHTANC